MADDIKGQTAKATLHDTDQFLINDAENSNVDKSVTALVIKTKCQEIKLDDLTTPDDNTDLDATTLKHGLMPKADKSKLNDIESGATADQTDAEIKTAYENNADTNAFTDADHSKLDGIAAGAEVNPDVVSQAEAEAGTATTERIWTAQRVAQAIAALESGGGGGFSTVYKTSDETINNDNTLTDDADLQFSVDANGIYAFIIVVFLDTGTTEDFKWTFSDPTGGGGYYIKDLSSDMETSTSVGSGASSSTNGNINKAQAFHGVFTNGANAGTLAYQWAQKTAGATDTTVKLGSWMMYKKLN